jgi:hypothetical protein
MDIEKRVMARLRMNLMRLNSDQTNKRMETETKIMENGIRWLALMISLPSDAEGLMIK